MKALKIKIKDSYATGFVKMVDDLLQKQYDDVDDMLMIAGLSELRNRLIVKQLKNQTEYTITLTAVQALSIRALFTSYVQDSTTALGNYLHMISNQVEQNYQ